ncbi:MAG: helix-turn-helix domain-containing protein [Acutalibacteraceae bacterium]|nr:helix-turn-helix domain-containing protein [Acutalibacteraceae bacterium]
MRTPKTESKKQEAALIGARLKKVRKEAGLSLQEIADRLNRDFNANTNKGMISKYENGIHEPSAGTVYCLARIFGVSADYLMCKTDEMMANDWQSEPGAGNMGHSVIIYTRCNPSDGGDIEKGEYEMIPFQWTIGGHEYFGFRITGSEYAPRYYDGDVILFERRSKVQRDRVALVSINGGDAFLCHIVRKRSGKSIIPLDRRLDELYFTTEELETSDIQILGGAVQVRRMEYSITF